VTDILWWLPGCKLLCRCAPTRWPIANYNGEGGQEGAGCACVWNACLPRIVGVPKLIEIKDRTTGAILHQIDARRLDKANLAGLCLRNANLAGAALSKATLRGADLENADFSFANLSYSDLEGAVLAGANLNCAMLIQTRMVQADLRRTNLKNASLFQADLRGAILTGAQLAGADLTECDLTNADVSHAVFDDRTRWPDGFDPLDGGAVQDAHPG